MKKINKEMLLKSSFLAGIIIYVVYAIVNRFVGIPDEVAIPIIIICIILLLVGITNMGRDAAKSNQRMNKELKKKNESKRTDHKL